MRIKVIVTCIVLTWAAGSFAQENKHPVLVNLKDGTSVDAIHFGKLKCGKEVYGMNYIIVRGKYMDSPTEIKNYKEIEKIVPEGYTDAPVASAGNQKGTLHITKKDGVAVTLDNAEMVMSCYAPGDLYNTIVVQIINPLTNQPTERVIETRNIQSIIFK